MRKLRAILGMCRAVVILYSEIVLVSKVKLLFEGCLTVAMLASALLVLLFGFPNSSLIKDVILCIVFTNMATATYDLYRVSIRLAQINRFSFNKKPVSAAFFLYIFLSKTDRETIPGDLDEEFATVILPTFGPFRAWLWYWVQVIRTIAYRNAVCRWVLIGGGAFKIGEWLAHKIRG
jgi:hypothetical protein